VDGLCKGLKIRNHKQYITPQRQSNLMDEKFDQTLKLVLKCIDKISYILHNNKGGI